MKYYELYTSAVFCGTDSTELISISDEKNIDDYVNENEIRENLFDEYGYMINGFYGDDPTEEEYEDFINDCEVILTELTEEEFEEKIDEGYFVENY